MVTTRLSGTLVRVTDRLPPADPAAPVLLYLHGNGGNLANRIGRLDAYRALGWGAQQDGYDTVEWLATQPWSTGKIGTMGSSQAGFAQMWCAGWLPSGACIQVSRLRR